MFPCQGKRDRIRLRHCSVPEWWPGFVSRVCLVSKPLIIICDEELTVLLEFNCIGQENIHDLVNYALSVQGGKFFWVTQIGQHPMVCILSE
jgi:hypothetical protein